MRVVVRETAAAWPQGPAYVWCCGNFTSERLFAGLGFAPHSSDVSSYTTAITWWLTSQPTGPLDDGVGTVATLMLGTPASWAAWTAMGSGVSVLCVPAETSGRPSTPKTVERDAISRCKRPRPEALRGGLVPPPCRLRISSWRVPSHGCCGSGTCSNVQVKAATEPPGCVSDA
ncbi:putative antirestriction adenine methyltransferase [Actinacidiphila epipremni]|uniref:putative antirestriction adenine methyltransferase n=1 Tax=Actinacidiphila epipremni TaxID=2053013 RepID=UPI0038993DE9